MILAEGIVIIAALVSLSIWIYLWLNKIAFAQRKSVQKGIQGSWMLLAIHLAVTHVTIQLRNYESLITDGLSIQNTLQVAAILISAGWAIWVLLMRWVTFATLLSGSNFWLTALVSLFIASASWSLWPEFTLIRGLELLAFWIIAAHIFSNVDWQVRLEKFLWITLYILWTGAIAILLFSENTLTHPLDAIRSNIGGLIAGALSLYVLYKAIYLRNQTHWMTIAIPLLSLIAFNSLSSILSFLVAFFYLLLYSGTGYKRVAFGLLLTFSISINAFYLTQANTSDVDTLTETVASLVGKQEEHLMTFTGRIPLWVAIWENTKSRPFGMGYAAGERRFEAEYNISDTVGWMPRNAHNGYISAWLSAGWPALVVILILFFSVFLRLTTLSNDSRPLTVSLMVLILINNLTLSAVGGQLTPAWIILMALSAAVIRRRQTQNIAAYPSEAKQQ